MGKTNRKRGKTMQITEKVSPMHPDKIADRIAGALVDYCYTKEQNPKCAFEVLIGHGHCFITGETSVAIPTEFVRDTVLRINKENIPEIRYIEAPQDTHLAENQKELKCGDNGIFAGFPMPLIHKAALEICQGLYSKYATDGKIVLNGTTKELTICWSCASDDEIKKICPRATLINPLGFWTGGINVDTGITGRKLASDFYGIEHALGGGTIHGKDLSKADCSVNIYCFVKAQETGKDYKAICSIGDKKVNVNGSLVDFSEIVKVAKEYVKRIGGFEKLAEWGLR